MVAEAGSLVALPRTRLRNLRQHHVLNLFVFRNVKMIERPRVEANVRVAQINIFHARSARVRSVHLRPATGGLGWQRSFAARILSRIAQCSDFVEV